MAITTIVIRAITRNTVKDHTYQARPGPVQLLKCCASILGLGMARLDHQQHAIHFGCQNLNIRNQRRRAIHDDHLRSFGQIPEYLKEREGGVLCDPLEPALMIDAAVSLLKNSDERRRMGDCNRRFIREQFSWDKMAPALETLYAHMTEHPRVAQRADMS